LLVVCRVKGHLLHLSRVVGVQHRELDGLSVGREMAIRSDLVTVYKALPAAYRSSATCLLNADDFGSLAGLVDTAGGLVLPSLQFDPPALFGGPVLISAELPAPAAKFLGFGDWRTAYCVRRMRAVTLQRADELHSDTGQVGYRATARVDGRPLVTDAARILTHSAT
jgi:HK97 family phage major capsid protein